MIELTRTNDPVFLSWLVSALRETGIEPVVFDGHASVMEGSVSAIQRRVMVDAGRRTEAERILAEGVALGRVK